MINFNDDLITDIINSELERGGRSSFTTGLKTYSRCVTYCIVWCRRHKYVAHGQMDAETLEKDSGVYSGRYDILLATTIIEKASIFPMPTR